MSTSWVQGYHHETPWCCVYLAVVLFFRFLSCVNVVLSPVAAFDSTNRSAGAAVMEEQALDFLRSVVYVVSA